MTATSVDGDTGLLHTSGKANPGNIFRYDSSLHGYVLNLDTAGLRSGTHTLYFSVSGYPVVYSITFIIK